MATSAASTTTVDARTLHFDLRHAGEGDFTLHVGGRRYPLKAHTPETRAGSTNSIVRATADDSRITHYAEDVEQPSNAVLMRWVTSPMPDNTGERLAVSSISVPPERMQAARTPVGRRAVGTPVSLHPLLAQLGVAGTGDEDPAALKATIDIDTPADAAVSIIFHHPEVTNLDTSCAATVLDDISKAQGLTELADVISSQGQTGWCASVPTMDPYAAQPNTPLVKNGVQLYEQSLSPQTLAALATPLADALNIIKNDPRLQDTSWSVQPGTATVASSPVPSPQAFAASPLAARSSQADVARPGSSDGSNGIAVGLKNESSMSGVSYDLVSFVSTSTGATLTFSITNYYLRYLSAYVEFLDVNGNPVTPAGWQSLLTVDMLSDWETATLKYLGKIAARDHFMFAPLATTPTELTAPWPTDGSGNLLATEARLLAGGLGLTACASGDTVTTYQGLAWTCIVDLGIPAIMLAIGLGEAPGFQQSFLEAVKSPGLMDAIKIAGQFIIQGVSAGFDASDGDIQAVISDLGSLITGVIKASPALCAWLAGMGAAEEAADQVPFVGWALEVLDLASTLANLVETTVEILMSPKVYENRLSLTYDLTLTLHPDPTDPLGFPQSATQLVIVSTFSDLTTRRDQQQVTDPGTQRMVVPLLGLPAGGTVSIIASFYNEADDLVGQAVSAEMANNPPPGQSTLAIDLTIAEILVPLTATTVYQHRKKLVYANGVRSWEATDTAPVATLADLTQSQSGNNLSALNGMELTEGVAPAGSILLLGYGWTGSGQGVPPVGSSVIVPDDLAVFQQLSAVDPGDQASMKFTDHGFAPPAPRLVFQRTIPSTGQPNLFWIDPRPTGTATGYCLRRITLDGTPTYDLSTGQAWGRFTELLDDAAVHPNGYVVGVNRANSKLEILQVSPTAVADGTAPFALVVSGVGDRAGLMYGPALITVSPDGTLYILEAEGMRIQAFDLHGNPCSIFSGTDPSWFALTSETGPVEYLDLSTDVKGYIFVLSYANQGSAPSDYRLDIYKPDGTFLTRTSGIPAANMAVDLWRNVFTLNYEMLAKPQGEGTEPSLSEWVPD